MSERLQGHDMQMLGHVLKELMPGVGFALIVFEFHRPGQSNYVSNAKRAEMITALREAADRLEAGQDFATPTHN